MAGFFSVYKNKVFHRRNFHRRFERIVFNHASAVLLVILVYMIYSSINFYIHFLSVEAWFLMRFFILVFVLFGWVPGLFVKKLSKGKALIIFENVPKLLRFISGSKPRFSKDFKLAVLAVSVKVFYIPIMLQFTVGNFFALRNTISKTTFFHFSLSYFNFFFYPLLLSVFFFFDVLIFLFAYAVELPLLNNVVRSVEPTLLGWVVALICYPPFNSLSSRIFGWGANDYAFFGSQLSTFLVRFFVLIPLVFIYFSATLALNFKAGNLVHRGIVRRFPYSLVRHPAYASKTLFWFITALPTRRLSLIFAMLAWMLVYMLRGLTEENHLGRDPDYRKYMKQVKFRFYPGLF